MALRRVAPEAVPTRAKKSGPRVLHLVTAFDLWIRITAIIRRA